MQSKLEFHSRDDMPAGFAEVFKLLLDTVYVQAALKMRTIVGLPENFD
jgi:hypothetical protein